MRGELELPDFGLAWLFYAIGIGAGLLTFVMLVRKKAGLSGLLAIPPTLAAATYAGRVWGGMSYGQMAGIWDALRDASRLQYEGEQSLIGVLLGGAIGAALSGAALRHRAAVILAAWLTAVCAAQVIGRLGCLFGGCCYGFPTSVPWGVPYVVKVNAGAVMGSLPLHPVPAYESIGALALLGLMARRWSRGTAIEVSAVYLVGYGILRAGLELIRAEPVARWFGLSVSQIAMLFAVGSGVVLWVQGSSRRPRGGRTLRGRFYRPRGALSCPGLPSPGAPMSEPRARCRANRSPRAS